MLAMTRLHTQALRLSLLLVLMVWAMGLGAQDSDERLHWVTSWAMSPSSLPASLDPATEPQLVNRTLRQVIHTSAGGQALRLRISNTHGTSALQIGAASIALQDNGSTIQAGSLHPLSFSQQQSISIPRGATVFSDPIPFAVPATSNLSISLYLPAGSSKLTTHLAAQQTAWVSTPGDFTGSTDFAVAEETSAWNFITALDVGRTDPATTIVAVGDSITDGVGSSRDANQRWPNLFYQRLLAEPRMPAFAVANAGLSGNRVVQENSPRFGENLQARFERDVLALSNVSHIILLEGINDIGMANLYPGEEVSAEEIITAYRQIIARSRARGIRIIGATLTPYAGAGYYREEGDLKRQQVNAWIRNSGEFDGVIDFEAATRDPADPKQLIPRFTQDKLHPNDEGYRAMAEIIDLNLFRTDAQR
ncbi:MAG: SGNH/GDSL hydrolase family protein [Pseudomonadales bacterium]|nr:SGNH/GDSL hydrolase family protein [Pseudomonadales bacterium]